MTSAPPSSSNADDREHIPAEYEPLTEHTAAYFKWYSTAAARLVFQLDTLDTMPADQLQISIAAREYPRGEIQAVDESDPFSVRSDTDEVDIEIEYSIDP